MEKTIFVSNGTTIKVPEHANKLTVQAIQKGRRVMVTWKGLV